MLTQREVLELGEMATGHISLVEKFGTYAQQTQDPQIRQLLQRHQQVLQQHQQAVVSLLQNTAQGGTRFQS